MRKSRFNNFCDDNFKYKGNCFSKFDYSNIYCDDFVVQGFCITDEYYLVTAYYRIFNNKKNSRVYFYEKDTGKFVGYVVLNNNAHVGGITFDIKNRIVYITGKKGKINAYLYDSLIKSLEGNYLIEIGSSALDISNDLSGNVSAATLYFYDNSLYICTCSCHGVMIKYEVMYNKETNNINVINKDIFNCLPSCIQGLVVFKYEEKNYYVISQSYSKLRSILKLMTFDGDCIGQKIVSLRGLEGIDIDYCGNIHCIFENGIVTSSIFKLYELSHSINRILEYEYYLMGKKHQKKLDKNSY